MKAGQKAGRQTVNKVDPIQELRSIYQLPTAPPFDPIESKMRILSERTRFSFSEIASGMVEMARAGISSAKAFDALAKSMESLKK